MTQYFDTQAFVRRMETAGMARAVAEELADALGSVVLDGLSTRRDVEEASARQDANLRETELRLRQDLKELELRVGQNIKDLELRITIRLGAMLAATTTLAVAILGALIAFK
ncbi:hypothetical protein [uncultured Sphingomonas sp.]|uniref:hypothetical protein n=1 Tax=uncultured Sphingomonas sp. TaxID=158754 RepID=UPI0035C9781E